MKKEQQDKIAKDMDPKKLALKGIIRAGIVLVIMGIGLYFQSKKGIDQQFFSILAVTIIAAAVSGFSVIYDYDLWTTKKKIIVHTICMAIAVFPALSISGWYDLSSIEGVFGMITTFIMFGVIAASIGYLVSKYILKNVPVQ